MSTGTDTVRHTCQQACALCTYVQESNLGSYSESGVGGDFTWRPIISYPSVLATSRTFFLTPFKEEPCSRRPGTWMTASLMLPVHARKGQFTGHMTILQCCGSGSVQIRIQLTLPDTDPYSEYRSGSLTLYFDLLSMGYKAQLTGNIHINLPALF